LEIGEMPQRFSPLHNREALSRDGGLPLE
jgi:hypothetical protein